MTAPPKEKRGLCGAANLKSPVVRCKLMQLLLRKWQGKLTTSEFAIVMMIFDRTIMWGNPNERITLRQFMLGVRGRDGTIYSEGTGLSKKGVVHILQRLLQNDCIRRFEDGDEIHYEINFDWSPMKLKIPKKRLPKVTQKVTRGNPQVVTQGNPKNVQEKNSPLERKEEQVNPSKTTGIVSQIIKNSEKKEAISAAARLRLSNPSIALLEKIWVSAWREVFAGTPLPVWRNKHERFALKAYCNRWRKVQPAAFGEYLDWCIRNWRPIMNHYFKWMDTRPELPSAFFLIRMADTFENCFNRRKELQELWQLPSREGLIELRVRKGMSYENAVKEVDQKLGWNAEFEKIQQARQQLANEKESAIRAERRAEVEKIRIAARGRRNAANRIEPIPVKRLLDYSQVDDSQFDQTDFGPYEEVPVGG